MFDPNPPQIISWKDIEVGKSYTFIIVDFPRCEEETLYQNSKGYVTNYLKFKVVPQDNYNCNIKKDKLTFLLVGKKTFQIAWNSYPQPIRYKENETYKVKVSFVRETIKRLLITKVEILQKKED